MSIHTPLPDLAVTFQYLKLMDKLSIIHAHSLQAQVWRDAATDPRTVKVAAREIHEQLQDNRVLVVDMVGQDVVAIVDRIFEDRP